MTVYQLIHCKVLKIWEGVGGCPRRRESFPPTPTNYCAPKEVNSAQSADGEIGTGGWDEGCGFPGLRIETWGTRRLRLVDAQPRQFLYQADGLKGNRDHLTHQPDNVLGIILPVRIVHNPRARIGRDAVLVHYPFEGAAVAQPVVVSLRRNPAEGQEFVVLELRLVLGERHLLDAPIQLAGLSPLKRILRLLLIVDVLYRNYLMVFTYPSSKMLARPMADDEKIGKPWRDDELDAIVSDYFAMLAADLAGNPYVKSRHSAALMAQIGRTHRSVEFKHQNISAVLDELGLPWIPGYMPKRNYQNAIFDAIDRYLTWHPDILVSVPVTQEEPTLSSAIFVDPPSRTAAKQPIPERLKRLVRKFDPVERDLRNRTLGKAGEAFVVEIERKQLAQADRDDLARKVRWVAEEDGDGAGYDIYSFDPYGHERLIEVKTTNGAARTPFFLSRNECELAAERPTDWSIYRVHLFARQPRIFTISPPLENSVYLRPETWRASF